MQYRKQVEQVELVRSRLGGRGLMGVCESPKGSWTDTQKLYAFAVLLKGDDTKGGR